MIEDTEFMLEAIKLAELARPLAPPNPWVGCVIVKNGAIIGSGYTQTPGGNHAEIEALEEAGMTAAGSTVYTTLEPCVHHGRTPPCIEAIIKAKVARVVIGIEDPDENVSGQGVSKLKAAGIEVAKNVCEEEVRQQLLPYLYHRKTGKPYCILKAAISIDGRIAAADGSSKWISSSESREDVHHLRATSQAIIIGAGTALKDDPSLTVRNVTPMPASPPLRVLIDPTGIVPATGHFFDKKLGPSLIYTSSNCSKERLQEWQQKEVQVVTIKENTDKELDYNEILKDLAGRGVLQALVEGGGHILGQMIKHQLENRLIVYYSPLILGDAGVPLFKDYEIPTMSEAPSFELIDCKMLGTSIRLEYVREKRYR